MFHYHQIGQKNKKPAGMMHAVVFIYGPLLLALFVGVLTGMEPLLSIKIGMAVLLLLFLIVVWNLPKLKTAPYRQLNYLLATLVIVSIFWPTYAFFSFGGLPTIDPKKILLLLLLLIWTFSVITSPELWRRMAGRMRLAGWPVVILLLFMLWRSLSVFSADKLGNSFIQLGWEFLSFYLVFFAALSCINGLEDLRRITMVLVVSSVLISLLGIVERVVGHSLLTGLIPLNPEYATAQVAALDIKLREGATRVQATFEHPMAMAEFLIFVLPFAAFTAMKAKGKIARLTALCGIGLILIAISLSATRSAYMAAAGLAMLGLVLFFLRGLLRGKLGFKGYFSLLGLMVLSLGALASLGIATQLVQGRSGMEQASTLERVEQLQRGLPKVENKPFLGAGMGAGNDEIGFSAARGRLYVDNYYLTLALDSGLPAMVLFLLVMGGFSWMGARLYFKGEGEAAVLAGALGLSVVGVAVVKFVLSIHYNLLFVYLTFAMLIVLKEQIVTQKHLVR